MNKCLTGIVKNVIAETVTNISPKKGGQVFFDGTIWSVKSKNSIKKGEKVKIVSDLQGDDVSPYVWVAKIERENKQ